MKYTAEEVRALTNVFEHGPVFDMLNAYADKLEAAIKGES